MPRLLFLIISLLTASVLFLSCCGPICEGKRPWLAPNSTPQSESAPASDPLVLLSPNGTEIWSTETTQRITWQTNTSVRIDSVRITLHDETGSEDAAEYLVAVVPGNPGDWTWRNAGPACDHCRIGIFGYAKEKILLQDFSDETFTITGGINVSDPLPGAGR